MTLVTWLSLMGGIVAVGILIIDQASLAMEIEVYRKETSRFPLFAARDHLILLVAQDKVDERDPAWQSMYRAINSLLGSQERLDLIGLLIRLVRYRMQLDSDPGLKERVERLTAQKKDLGKRVPEFKFVQREADRALAHLVRRRTKVWHRQAVFAGFLLLTFAIVALRAGIQTAQAVERVLSSPSTIDIQGLQAAEC